MKHRAQFALNPPERGKLFDVGMPRQTFVNQVNFPNDLAAGTHLSIGVTVAAHDPHNVPDHQRGPKVVRDDDDGVGVVWDAPCPAVPSTSPDRIAKRRLSEKVSVLLAAHRAEHSRAARIVDSSEQRRVAPVAPGCLRRLLL
jgi:hypothetical protein